MNLDNIFTLQSKRSKDKVLMICEDKRITYGEMHARVNSLAKGLFTLGIKKGDKVATLFPNGIETVLTLWALLKIGAINVPLNYWLKPEDLFEIINHADAKLLIYSKDFEKMNWNLLQELKKQMLLITTGETKYSEIISFQEILSTQDKGEPEYPVSLKDESLIIYTSGTTGKPKGVVLTQENLFFNTLNYALAYGMNELDIELALTPPFHASTLGRIITYIFCGATFVTSRRFDPVEALKLIEQEKVTSITQAPTMYVAMMNQNREHINTSSVRRVVTGAAPMTSGLKKELKMLFPNAQFFDLYGLTEASPGVSILRPEVFFEKIESVGKPMTFVEVKIVDEQGNEVPAGQIGEIICRGPNIMKGYYKDPQATKEVLRDGWLYTGDLGRMDEDGFLYLVDRKKDLIISGGENIYPGEIEQVLLEHPAIQEAAVIGVPDPYWGEKVKAFIVLKQGAFMTKEEVISHCAEHLASYKKPKEVEFIESLPRNATNKVIKEILRKRDSSQRS